MNNDKLFEEIHSLGHASGAEKLNAKPHLIGPFIAYLFSCPNGETYCCVYTFPRMLFLPTCLRVRNKKVKNLRLVNALRIVVLHVSFVVSSMRHVRPFAV
jgi:hypothetical protein